VCGDGANSILTQPPSHRLMDNKTLSMTKAKEACCGAWCFFQGGLKFCFPTGRWCILKPPPPVLIPREVAVQNPKTEGKRHGNLTWVCSFVCARVHTAEAIQKTNLVPIRAFDSVAYWGHKDRPKLRAGGRLLHAGKGHHTFSWTFAGSADAGHLLQCARFWDLDRVFQFPHTDCDHWTGSR